MLLLSITSWLVESKKWQLLTKEVQELRFRESVLQSLTAQAASFITPLRAGEFAFKAMFFEKKQRKFILSRVFTGNLSQMIITVILGLIGLLFLLDSDDVDSVLFFTYILLILGCIISIAFLWIQKKWRLKKVKQALWVKVLGFSFFRYLLFSSNWLLILWSLKSDISPITWLDNIAVNYLAVSAIPMFQIADIPVKWTAAAYIFNGTTYNADHIILATTIVWLTNTLFPTLLGCMLLPFKKLKT